MAMHGMVMENELTGSIYWSEQTSMRTRVLLMIDWVKRGIFGRDLSKVSMTFINRHCALGSSYADAQF